MTTKLRKLFESELKDYLKSNFDLGSNVRYLKNAISIRKTKQNESSGYVGFRFLNNACGYILCAGADSPELLQFFKK
ncbi:hypothetical protein [Commensalibacter communis]|uniref:hypothetical protein n=1 Tax=Commensalibacter communis TaxID=2972786 RepID=UPI0022FFC428|nr:hypothetical protein [Commensalibacter communis]CAI3938715.1 unnamed protein product [Commensalibacter communis]CAI3939538.1 unnamed protein product [Commensalibacter communis]